MATLGTRGTGAFSNDERPKNWRQMLLMLFPNGEAPLTAFLSKMKDEATDDPEFNWWEKGLPSQRTTINFGAGYNAAATAFVVADGTIFKKGHVLLDLRTNEQMFVTTDGTTTGVVVARGKGEVAAAALLDTDILEILGTVHEEGDGAPNIITYAPSKQYNFTEIFKTTLGMTRTARKTRLRWDRRGPYNEAKREALQLHGIQMEKQFLLGQRFEEVGPNGFPRRTTRGMFNWITSNKIKDADTDGIWGNADFDLAFEALFRYGSSEKLALMGSTAISTVNAWAKGRAVVNLVPESQVYGLKITEIISPFGNLYMKNHPLLSDHPVFRKDMLVLDMDKITFRYIDDTTFLRNLQAPDQDATKDGYITECGLEVNHEKAHGWLQNMASYSSAE